MLNLWDFINKKILQKYKNHKFYKDFNARKKQIEKLSRKQTLDFLIPHIVEYILKTDNYLITLKQAQTLAKNYFTYFKYKDLYVELDNYTERLW